VTRKPILLSTCEACGAEAWSAPTGQQPEHMAHRGWCPFIHARRACDWCGGPLRADAQPTAETHGGRCRAARWKYRNQYGRNGNTPGPRSGENARSGLQVSYGKAVDVLEAWLYRLYPITADEDNEQDRREAARREAELVMKAALSEKQRKRLEARSG
jgi:hypothetical protein